jgi:hypothetical protein
MIDLMAFCKAGRCWEYMRAKAVSAAVVPADGSAVA